MVINVIFKRIYICTISSFVFLLLLSQITLAKANSNQWELGRNEVDGLVHSGAIRNLRSTVNGKYLIYGKRRYGINLVWTAKVKGRHYKNSFKFERKNKRDRSPLKYGELVAIHVYRGGYIKYKKRKWGINLSWSKSPSYQWKITGGDNGTQIRYQGNLVGIYNTKARNHIVYCKRSWGINLRWAKDCKRSGRSSGPRELSFTYWLKAQKVAQGVRPYLLNWNPGPPKNAYLKSITITKAAGFSGYIVHLIKKDKPFKDCGTASASITLRPGETTTASQLRSLYGTTKPRPIVPILACITQVNPNQRIDNIPVRIVYVRE